MSSSTNQTQPESLSLGKSMSSKNIQTSIATFSASSTFMKTTGRSDNPGAYPGRAPSSSKASFSPHQDSEASRTEARGVKSGTSFTMIIIGHVAHGKSMLVRAIAGMNDMRHKAEMKRNMTAKFDLVSADVYKCSATSCSRPGCYASNGCGEDLQGTTCMRDGCLGKYDLVRKVSFVDCAEHDILIRTVLAGTSTVDAALLIISAEEKCPQPQTIEHSAAIEALGLKNIVILQNKIGCVSAAAASKHARQVRRFLKGTVAEDAPIIPISAQKIINIDTVLDILANFNVSAGDTTSLPQMCIVRSFDINKPGTGTFDLKGGVVRGALMRGTLRVDDEIEIRPRLILGDAATRMLRWKPLFSRVTSLSAESQHLESATPGDLIGVGTQLDPLVCGADRLVGQVIGLRGTLPLVFISLTVSFKLMTFFEESNEVRCKGTIRKDEAVMLNIGSAAVEGRVIRVKGHKMVVELQSLACVDLGARVALSRFYWDIGDWLEWVVFRKV